METKTVSSTNILTTLVHCEKHCTYDFTLVIPMIEMVYLLVIALIYTDFASVLLFDNSFFTLDHFRFLTGILVLDKEFLLYSL